MLTILASHGYCDNVTCHPNLWVVRESSVSWCEPRVQFPWYMETAGPFRKADIFAHMHIYLHICT